MDEDRKIRFLISPLLFFASLAWAVLCDGTKSLTDVLYGFGLKPDNLQNLVALLAAGGIAVFAMGYVIGTTSYVLLRLPFIVAFWFGWGYGSHEIRLPATDLALVWARINAPGPPDKNQEFVAGATFDHDVLRRDHEGVHRWLVRRWNAFSVAVTSLTGLLLSLLIVALIQIRYSMKWGIPVTVVSAVLCTSAILAWWDTMRMLRFQAARQQPHSNG
jgi:hypothetical protein